KHSAKIHGQFNNVVIVSHCGGPDKPGPGAQLRPKGDRLDWASRTLEVEKCIRDALKPDGIFNFCTCGYRDYKGEDAVLNDKQWEKALQLTANWLNRQVCACPDASHSQESFGCMCNKEKIGGEQTKVCKKPIAQVDRR